MADAKYCPQCGAEYRPGFEMCADCHVPLVDEPPALVVADERAEVVLRERVSIFRSGRRIDAELVRGRLESCGIDARIWSRGLGVWRMESALTEVTGIPSDFNAHHVVVDHDDVDEALQVLREEAVPPGDADNEEGVGHGTSMSWLRPRWLLIAFAIFLLVLVLIVGPPG